MMSVAPSATDEHDDVQVDDQSDIVPLRSIWDCEFLKKSHNFWQCLWCKKSFSGLPNASRALNHLLRIKGAKSSSVSPCTARIPPKYIRQYQDLRTRLSFRGLAGKRSSAELYGECINHVMSADPSTPMNDSPDTGMSSLTELSSLNAFHGSKHNNNVSTVTPHAALADVKKDLWTSSKHCSVAKKPSFATDNSVTYSVQPTINSFIPRVPNQKQLNIRCNNGVGQIVAVGDSNLDFAIANMIHCLGLPFSFSEEPAFLSVLKMSRFMSREYLPPNRKRVAGELLDKNFNRTTESSIELLKKEASMYGMALIGDGATIRKMPLMNIISSSTSNPVCICDIVDNTNHLQQGIGKTGDTIAGDCLRVMVQLDPHYQLYDCVMFDGASNVVKAGQCIMQRFPKVTLIHGAEHVLNLFCKDVLCLSRIRHLLSKYRFIYSIFGSGMSHKAYSIFMKQSQVFNCGKKIGLIQAAHTRFGGYWYAFHRLLKLQHPLVATINTPEWVHDVTFNKKKGQKAKVEVLLHSESFWKEVRIMVELLFYVIKLLRFSDSNKPGMDKLYYYASLTTEYLDTRRHLLDIDNVFQNSEIEENMEEFDDILDEEDLQGVDESKLLIDHLPLGQQVKALWSRRLPKLQHEYSVVGWLLSVDPDVYNSARSFTSDHVETLKVVGCRLLHFEDEHKQNHHLSLLVEQFMSFRSQSGRPYSDPMVWSSPHCKEGNSHIWHYQYSRPWNRELSYVACRVTSKLLGIGSAERCWGDVKHLKSNKRSHLSATTAKQQSMIYGSYCLQKARIKRQARADITEEQDFASLDLFDDYTYFSDDMIDDKEVISKLELVNAKKVARASTAQFVNNCLEDAFHARRKFKCFTEPWERRALVDKDPTFKHKLLKKFGGVRYVNPDIGPIIPSYTISLFKMEKLAEEGCHKKKWCAFGVPKGLTDSDSNVANFDIVSINDELYDQIKLAPQDNVVLIDETGAVIDQSSFRKTNWPSLKLSQDWKDFQDFHNWPDEVIEQAMSSIDVSEPYSDSDDESDN